MANFSTVLARAFVAGVLTVAAGAAAAQQTYPSKPIHFIVPFAPGSAIDVLARLVGQKIPASWGQQVIVENRPGGNTVIGTEALAKSAPDGYALILVSTGHVINPSLFTTPYDAINDFIAVATVSSTDYILVVHPSLPANTLQQFIALARSRPGELNYATPGSGTPTHLATALFENRTGVKMQPITYNGGGPMNVALIGGEVHLAFQTPINVLGAVKSGKLRALAVSGESRMAALPQVPTFAEGGVSGLDLKTWFGFLAPAGTPKAIVDKLSSEIARILALADTKERLTSLGMDPFVSTPEQFAALMKSDLTRYANLIKSANIKADQ